MNKSTLIAIIIGLILIVAAFFLGRCSVKTPEPEVVVKTDTITKRVVDSIFIEKPKYITRQILDTIYIEKDTILYVESKTYEDSLSTIWISGIQPSVDSIEYRIPRDSIFINTETTITKVKDKHWKQFIGISFSAGAMAGYNPIDKTAAIVAPGVGITITYGFGYTW